MSLTVRNLQFSYGKKTILKGINFEIHSGCLTAIMGENGSGKTTLLKNINRILKPDAGSVLVDDITVEEISHRDIARHIGYLPQRQETANCTVFEAVLLGRKARAGFARDKNDSSKVEEVLRLVHLEDLAMRPTTQLSGGEMQRVILARALAQEPKVLLLDEPINHLDPVNQIEVMSLLHAVTKAFNITSLLVSHDLNSALRFADQFIMLKKGDIYACGDKSIVTPEAIKDVFHVDAIIEEVAGVPVVIPILKEVRAHTHYHTHAHSHDGSEEDLQHRHKHVHEVDSHIYDHEHQEKETLHSEDPSSHNHKNKPGSRHE